MDGQNDQKVLENASIMDRPLVTSHFERGQEQQVNSRRTRITSTSEDQGEDSTLSTQLESGREGAWPPINQPPDLDMPSRSKTGFETQGHRQLCEPQLNESEQHLIAAERKEKSSKKRTKDPPQEVSQLVTSTETADQSRKQRSKTQVFS